MKNLITKLILLFALHISSQPKVSFTFDDGSLSNKANYTFNQWNGMLLEKLKAAHVSAMFFVTGKHKMGPQGKKLLNGWNANGH